MATRALHVSDLHAGRRETPGLAEALRALAAELAPEVVVATGDLAHRGRPAQLAHALELLSGLGAPLLAVPGNHDIPYAFPARLTRPFRAFEQAVGPVDPSYASASLVLCGLSSVRPWRHQGGRLSTERLGRASRVLGAAPPGALRVVALHHHLAAAPWRAARKLPLAHRDRALAAFAAAGAEVVLGGHIHQATVVERHEIEALETETGPLLLVTAPGLGRPRPARTGEAQGLVVLGWDDATVSVETRVWRRDRFEPVGRREFGRARERIQ